MAYGKFTPQNIQGIRKQILNTLNQIGTTCGIDFKMGDIRYNDLSLSFEVVGQLNSEVAQKAIELERRRVWNEYCEDFGLKAEHFGMQIPTGHKKTDTTLTVVGLNLDKGMIIVKSSITNRCFLWKVDNFLEAVEKVNGKKIDKE